MGRFPNAAEYCDGQRNYGWDGYQGPKVVCVLSAERGRYHSDVRENSGAASTLHAGRAYLPTDAELY